MRRRSCKPGQTIGAMTGATLAVAVIVSCPAMAAETDAFRWDGIYFGGHVGMHFGRTRYGASPGDPFGRVSVPVKSQDGQFGPVVGGFTAGWNAQLPSSMLLGVEADTSFPNSAYVSRTGFGPGSSFQTVDQILAYGSLRGRVGYAFDNWLVYGTAGIAAVRDRSDRTQGFGVSFGGFAMSGDTETIRRWRVGVAAGAGIEWRLTPEWSAKLEYMFDGFASRGAFYPLSLQRTPGDLSLHNVRLGLNYHFGQKAVDEGGQSGLLPDLDMFSIHGQTTQVLQGGARFPARYSGTNSFDPRGQVRETVSITGNLGFRPWAGTEFYFNPEPFQGFGLSRTHGAAGFPNGEAQKGGSDFPQYNTARLFVRQTFGLGGEKEKIEDGANQFGGDVDISRITITAGKFAVADLFDNNQYAHDQRTGFLNWAIWDGGAFDYAADQKGYTWGAAIELNQKDWAARAGYFLEPSSSNSPNFDTRIGRRGQYIGEVEGRYSIAGQPGKLRVLGWFARNYAGSFAEVNDNLVYGGDITLTRRSRPESGFVVNLEQSVTDDLGVFARLSRRYGANEAMAFTDIDRSLSFGGVLKGSAWDRPQDKIGVAFAVNSLGEGYRAFLANGGLGINIGDGALTYRRESLVEAYYLVSLSKWSTLAFDYQYIANPGYNADRGPASIFTARLHTEF